MRGEDGACWGVRAFGAADLDCRFGKHTKIRKMGPTNFASARHHAIKNTHLASPSNALPSFLAASTCSALPLTAVTFLFPVLGLANAAVLSRMSSEPLTSSSC